jgi:hypothetical protein
MACSGTALPLPLSRINSALFISCFAIVVLVDAAQLLHLEKRRSIMPESAAIDGRFSLSYQEQVSLCVCRTLSAFTCVCSYV